MLESKSSALTKLAIPLHNRLSAVAAPLGCENVKRILDYDLSKCARGCLRIARAFHAVQSAGNWLNTSSACSSLSKGQNTQAPDPVILASPNLPSHSMAFAIGGKSRVATACKSFFP